MTNEIWGSKAKEAMNQAVDWIEKVTPHLPSTLMKADAMRICGNVAEVYHAPDEQADTIARLERELAEAQSQVTYLDVVTEALKAEAEALKALAAWVKTDPSMRTVKRMEAGQRLPWEVELRDDASAKWDFAGEGATLAAAIMDALGKAGR